jgi:hypothetical protein
MSRFKIVLWVSLGLSMAVLLTAALLPDMIAGSDREDMTLQYMSSPPKPEQIGKPLSAAPAGFVILKKEGDKYYYYEAIHTGDVRLAMVAAVGVYWLGFGLFLWIRSIRQRRPPEPLRKPHWRRSRSARA